MCEMLTVSVAVDLRATRSESRTAGWSGAFSQTQKAQLERVGNKWGIIGGGGLGCDLPAFRLLTRLSFHIDTGYG